MIRDLVQIRIYRKKSAVGDYPYEHENMKLYADIKKSESCSIGQKLPKRRLKKTINCTNDDKPIVSILMNCYNGEKYLHKSLDSILSQTLDN